MPFYEDVLHLFPPPKELQFKFLVLFEKEVSHWESWVLLPLGMDVNVRFVVTEKMELVFLF